MSAPLIFLTVLQHYFLTACIAFFDLGRLLLLAHCGPQKFRTE